VARVPLIVEVAGLAGSGKTTLSRMLCEQQSQRFQPGVRLRLKSIRHFPYSLRHGLFLLPKLLHSIRKRRLLTGEEMKKIAYVEGWHRVLTRQDTGANAVVVLDQGPVFCLATLYGFGPHWLRGEDFEPWWSRIFDQWSAVLRAVVCLHAPLDILLKRIKSRETNHIIKESSQREMREFLSCYRNAYEHVLCQLRARRELKVVHVSTARNSMGAVMMEVLDALHGEFARSRSARVNR